MSNSTKHFLQSVFAFSLVGVATTAQAGFTAYEAAISISSTVNSFKSALGTLNVNDGNHYASGRREITWDNVPDSAADPNLLPGDYFNSTGIADQAGGVSLSTPGTGFLVSADGSNPTSTEPGFGFPSEFIPFSGERLFTSLGSNITDITFYVPGTTTLGWVSGFGAVFSDVEFTNVTKIELFDVSGNSLYTRSVMTSGNAGLSFLGLIANAGERIGRVRITAGNDPLLSHGSFPGGATEGVVMDDFIYAEPQQALPEPGTAALFGIGCFWLTRHCRAGRRRAS